MSDINKLVRDFLHDGLRHRKWEIDDELYYCVGESPYAVTFTVRVPKEAARKPYAVDMSYHRSGGTEPGCLCLDGASCSTDGTSIGAREWYEMMAAADEGRVTDSEVFAHLRSVYQSWS